MSCVQMAIAYRKSTKSTSRKYERSPGMEPNVGGVTHMTVINPGAPRSNPFQWIRGGGRRGAARLSPQYKTVSGAAGWAKRHEGESKGARLAPVTEYGTILTRPLSRKQVLKNGRSSMSYNLRALKRAMRKNMSSSDRKAMLAAARGIDAPTRKAKKRRSRAKVSGGRVKATRRRSSAARTSRRRSSKKSSTRKRASKRTSRKTATAKGATSAAKSASKASKAAKKASTRAKRATSKKVASKAAKVASKAATRAKKAARKATSKAAKAKASSKRAANRAAAKARREAAAAEAAAASAATAARKASSRAARRGRISGRHGGFHTTSKARRSYRKVKGFSASPFRTGRLFNPPYINITSKHPKRRSAGIRMAANMLGRISQRRGVPTGQRVQLVEFGPRSKRKGYAVYVPGHVSERAYVRKFKFGGAAKRAHQRALQTGYSRKRYSKRAVSANSRRTSMRRNSRKRHSRKSSKRRRSSRRRSRRVSANRYFVMKNGRRRRRLRRNMTIWGVDPVTQVAIPGAYAVGGLMAANVLANYAASMPSITGVLDAGREDPIVTKSLAGAVGAGLTVAFGGKLPSMLRDHLGAIVAGMGCAVAVRLLRGTQAAPYLGSWGAGFGRLGEYVNQPLGEYVNQPLGAYVQDPSMGEYVDQPLGEYVDQPLGGLGTMYAAAGYPEGIDPADQGSVDGLMDTMEAAAGVGAFEAAAGMGTLYAAAGMGTLYAAAGMGQEGGTPGVVGSPIPIPTFTPPVGPNGYQQPPFISTETPIDPAKRVSATMFRDLPVKTSIVTPEGRGSAGGIFSRSIFGGMM